MSNPRAGLRKLGRGRYATADGRYVIESDSASMDEWDKLDDPEWFVYTAEHVERHPDYGPPEALADGFPTLREARAFAEERSTDG